MIRCVSGPPSSGSRALPRDVYELKALAEKNPALGTAVALQVDLIESVRRVQGRLTTPWIDASADALNARLASGQPLLDFAQLGFDRSEEHTSELQSPCNVVCRLVLEKQEHKETDFKVLVGIYQIGHTWALNEVSVLKSIRERMVDDDTGVDERAICVCGC